MSKQIRWLHSEISNWQSEQLISDQQAEQIRARYTVVEKTRTWDKLIFPTIGAVVFGLGIILFFAYNWADMHKYLKLAVVFGSLLIAHALGYLFTSPERPQHGLGEGSHVLGTMLFGAGIWLIAQIYHLDEHYPNAFLAWGMGALVFAWALPSVAQGLIAVVLLSLWSGMEIIDFRHTDHHSGWLLILCALIPLAWLLRSRLLLFFALLTFSVLFVYDVAVIKSSLFMYIPFYLACLYLALAKLVQPTRFPESASVLHFIGLTGYLLFLYLFSFQFYGRFFSEHPEFQGLSLAYTVVPSFLAGVAWPAVLFGKGWRRMSRLQRWETGSILTVMLLVAVTSLAPVRLKFDWFTLFILFNLGFLSHCVILIIQGIQQASWKRVSLGCVLMAALLFARFTDLFGSLLVRSAIFVLLGAGLFAVGHFYSKHKQRETADA